ncbi:MAG TPA: glycosyltransferase, partial [Polyangiaceae bacterium]|nr:glycosyltransferase [Polyangiaceae bacterium]
MTALPDTTAKPRSERARPLRVLMILESDFMKQGGGGAESQVRTLAAHLVKLKQGVTVVVPMLARGSQVKTERCQKIPVARIQYPYWRVIGGGIMCARFAAFLIANRNRYDAWHVHIAHHLGAVACLLGPLLNKPVIVKISGFWELERGIVAQKRSLLTKLARACFQRATVLQAISTRIAHDLVEQGFPEDRVVVLPNAVDTRRFHVESAPPEGPFTAVFVGRLVPEKDLTVLLRGWARAFRGQTDTRLMLVGRGPEEQSLRALAGELGIAEQVAFLGHCDSVQDLLARSHIGLLPSRVEGLSNTLLEYMASGLPTIATRVSGSEDFVDHERSGWLFEVGDEQALADHL